MTEIVYPIAGVRLAEHHLGSLGDLNDNDGFLYRLEVLGRKAKRNVRLEEYFHHFIELYEVDSEYAVYCTRETDYGVDGYILKGRSIKPLLEVVATIRQYHKPHEHIEEWFDVLVEEGWVNKEYQDKTNF